LPSDTLLSRKEYKMALIGTLKGFGITDIFQLISQQIKTGLLILTSTKETITVAFRDGIIQGVSSDKWEFDPRMDILLKARFINEKELRDSIENQKRNKGAWYDYLISKGIIKENILDKASIIIFRNTMLDVFQWEDGNYRFEDRDINTESMMACSLPTEGVVLDTLRIIDEIPIIRPKTPPLDYCPIAITPLTQEISIRYDLNSIDVVIYNLIDGEKTVQDIINQSLELPFEALASIVKLIEAGIVEVFPRGSMDKRDKTIAKEEAIRRIKVAAVYLSLLICIILLIILGKPRLLENPLEIGPVVSSQIKEQKSLAERIAKQVKAPSKPDKDNYDR
jgi:hypothetical protein